MKEKSISKKILGVLAAILVGIFLFSSCLISEVSAEEYNFDMDEVSDGVVRILVFKDGKPCQIGSGFGVGEAGQPTRYFITARHVVDLTAAYLQDEEMYGYSDMDEKGCIASEMYIMLQNDALSSNGINYDSMVKCKCIYTSTGNPDVAIIKADEVIKLRHALTLKKVETEENLKKLDSVFAFGFPVNSDIYNVSQDYRKFSYNCTKEDLTIANGTVSSLRKIKPYENNWCIQHTATVSNGDSGGPLVDKDGNVVGINVSVLGENSKYNNALYINYAMEMMDDKGIPYTEAGAVDAKEEKAGKEDAKQAKLEKEKIRKYCIYGGIALVICILIVIAIVIILKKKKNKGYNNYYGTGDNRDYFGIQEQKQHGSSDNAIPVMDYYKTPENINHNGNRQPASGSNKPSGGYDSLFSLQGINCSIGMKRIVIGKSLAIGTSPDINNLVFPKGTPGVSRKHCKIRTSGNGIYIKDYNSSYGTFVDGRKIEANKYVEIFEGSEIWIGGRNQKFKIEKSNRSR